VKRSSVISYIFSFITAKSIAQDAKQVKPKYNKNENIFNTNIETK
jgi:hypothetical protein